MRVVHMQNEHGIGGLETGHQMLCRCDSCTNCPICGAVSSSQHGLKIHLAQRHNLVDFFTEKGIYKFLLRKWSGTHIRTKHDISSNLNTCELQKLHNEVTLLFLLHFVNNLF